MSPFNRNGSASINTALSIHIILCFAFYHFSFHFSFQCVLFYRVFVKEAGTTSQTFFNGFNPASLNYAWPILFSFMLFSPSCRSCGWAVLLSHSALTCVHYNILKQVTALLYHTPFRPSFRSSRSHLLLQPQLQQAAPRRLAPACITAPVYYIPSFLPGVYCDNQSIQFGFPPATNREVQGDEYPGWHPWPLKGGNRRITHLAFISRLDRHEIHPKGTSVAAIWGLLTVTNSIMHLCTAFSPSLLHILCA